MNYDNWDDRVHYEPKVREALDAGDFAGAKQWLRSISDSELKEELRNLIDQKKEQA